ncbi:immunoglobulin iota chain-like [Heterodontus francisci]|uniref:immunoglobulin iota chain-like n=1 Tax=Heterodontus francisci TaxID=7792 RepID=UPI00355BEB25
MRRLSIWVVWGAFLTDLSHGGSVTQPRSPDVKTEGEAVILSCTYDTTRSEYSLYWYQQHPDTQPEFILRKDSDNYEDKADFAKNRFSAELHTVTKFTSLTISGLQLTDSAVYYCAFRLTVMESSLTPVQKLPLECGWELRSVGVCVESQADVQRQCAARCQALKHTPRGNQINLRSNCHPTVSRNGREIKLQNPIRQTDPAQKTYVRTPVLIPSLNNLLSCLRMLSSHFLVSPVVL